MAESENLELERYRKSRPSFECPVCVEKGLAEIKVTCLGHPERTSWESTRPF